MKVNSALSFNSKVNQNLGSNSQVQFQGFGRKKEQDSYQGSKSNEQTVTIPKHTFNNMMKVLAFAFTVGGAGLINSCSDASSPVAPQGGDITDTTTVHDTTGTDTTVVVPHENPVAVKHEFGSMLTALKLNLGTSGIHKSAQDGEFDSLGYYSPWANADIKLIPNRELSSKDTLVLDQKIKPRYNGPKHEYRHKLTKLGEGKLSDDVFSKDPYTGTYYSVDGDYYTIQDNTVTKRTHYDNSLDRKFFPKTDNSIKVTDGNTFETEFVDITMYD